MTRRFLPWAFLAALLTLTGLATLLLVGSHRAREAEAFGNAVQVTRDRIEARVHLYEALLRSTAGLVEVSGVGLSQAEFRAFVEQLDVAERYPGVQGIGFTRWLRDAASAAQVRAQWAEAGLPGVRPWPDTLAPGAERHAIVYLEPQDGRNRIALGFNMHDEAIRRDAMNRARDTGEFAFSGRVTLVQEVQGHRQSGFLLYLPVYVGATPTTLAERRARLDGFVYAPFRADDLFSGVFGSEAAPRVAFRIYDGAERPENLLHDSRTSGIEEAPGTRLRQTVEIPLSGRTWTVAFAATPALKDDVAERSPLTVAALGTLLSLLVFGLSRAQQRAAEVLGVRERELDAVVRALPQLVWRAEADGHTTWANDRWAETTGVDVVSDRPDGWTVAVASEAREDVRRDVAAARAEGAGWEGLVPLAVPGGAPVRWFWTQVVPVRDNAGHLVRWFGTLTDVTEREAAREAEARAAREQLAREASEAREADLKAHMQELERSNRELQEFASVASHDLQEPLRKIQTFAGLLRTDVEGLGETAAHYAERMQRAAERMSGLIKGVLSVSRVSQAELERKEVDLNVTADDVRRDLHVRLADTHGVLEAEALLPTIWADPVQMHRLLLNLVGNALKYHRPGVPPVVRLSAEAATLQTPHGRVPGARLVVSDNGLGIEPQHLVRIFAPFQRLHRHPDDDGTGIGLSLCRRIAERHGGTLTATSTPGQGSTFVVELPQPTTPASAALLPPPPGAAVA